MCRIQCLSVFALVFFAVHVSVVLGTHQTRLNVPLNLTYGVGYGDGHCMSASDCVRTESPSLNLVECWFSATQATLVPDGFSRDGFVVNLKFPGPCIEAVEGDTIRVHYVSEIPSMLHWHGFHQKANPQMDGTPLTQCHTVPNRAMTYEMIAERGTHWWHSHFEDDKSMQVMDGIQGPIIVRERAPLYTYDGERVLMIQDWFHDSGEFFKQNWDDMEFYQESTWGTTINHPEIVKPRRFYNKQGRFNDGNWFVPSAELQGDGQPVSFEPRNWTYDVHGALIGVTDFNSGLVNGKAQSATTEPEVIKVDAYKTYRFRLINSGSLFYLDVSIDGHPFNIIAADGALIQRSGAYDSIHIGPGERFDILVNTTNAVSNYWIRARTTESPSLNNSVLAVLRYTGAANSLPTTSRISARGVPWLTANCVVKGANCVPLTAEKPLRPAGPVSMLPKEDVLHVLNVGFSGGPHINSYHFKFPPNTGMRYFLDVDFFKRPNFSTCPQQACSAPSHCVCTNYISLQANQYVLLLLNSTWAQVNALERQAAAHPMHIHGHRPFILGMGYDNETFNASQLNYDNPIAKDTIMLPAGGWVAMMFLTDNPGSWLLHCHMDVHMVKGMTIMLDEAPEVRRSAGHTVPLNFPLCDDEDFIRVGSFRSQELPAASGVENDNLSSSSSGVSMSVFLGVVVGGGVAILLAVVVAWCSCKKVAFFKPHSSDAEYPLVTMEAPHTLNQPFLSKPRAL